MSQSTGRITSLLRRWEGGDEGARELLLAEVYADLKRLANHQMQHERVGHTLQPTALVHEAYVRMVGQRKRHWNGRAHFLAICAGMMRRVLVDHARRRVADKRGGGVAKVTLVDCAAPQGERHVVEIARLAQLLDQLERLSSRQARVVELRFFAGLTIRETAEVLGVSTATVKTDWALARAWLYRELGGG